jgi:isocitrate dehydrogenase (NAD+)
MAATLVVLEGDETGQELLQCALTLLDPALTGYDLTLERYDLGLEARRRSQNGVVTDAAQALRRHGFGLKAATATPPAAGDVGSPNALLREAIGATVILRIGRAIPGVVPHPPVRGPIAIVRMAVGDAYGAHEWRERVRRPDGSEDEVAMRIERISRSLCRAVAEAAFVHARRLGATVFGGPKFTVSPVYEGLLKEELDAAAARHPDVAYEPQLIDATYAMLERRAAEPIVVPALNRDGDCLSDLILPWFGSIAGAESSIIATDADGHAVVFLAEAPHGTAPQLQGLDRANPMAMILAEAAALEAMPEAEARMLGSALRAAVLQAVADGVRTRDLGGDASTTAFVRAVRQRLEGRLAGAKA